MRTDIVYYLMHKYTTKYGEIEWKGLGMYTSKRNVRNAIERYKIKDGFNKYPEVFFYKRFKINEELWGDGFDENDKGDIF